MKRLERLVWCACLAFSMALVSVVARKTTAQNSLTLPESSGKQIYLRGTSPSGKDILAYVGDSALEMPGSSMPCANCHGLDGQGKPEGSINPSNITWELLTKPYGLTHPDGRKHPPYTDRALELAITRRTDPAGNRLLNVMPRYVMSRPDLDDLVAYLGKLGKDRDPGVSESAIVIGLAVPARGALAELGQAIRAVTTACFDDVNTQGGIYNRRIELKFAETADTAAGTRVNVERLIRDEQVFALTGTVIAGAENEIIPLMAERGVPLIGLVTLYPQTTFPMNREVFYLLSGIDGQARVLIDFTLQKPELKNANIAVVYPQKEITAKIIEAINDQCGKDRLSPPQTYPYAAGSLAVAEITKQLKQANRQVVIFLGSGDEALSLMREAQKVDWYPFIFLLGSSGGAEMLQAPSGFNGKIFLSFPTTPADQTAAGIKDFRALAEKYKLPSKHLAAQLSAFTAARLLVEALRRAGKDLSREKLIRALEELYDYQTGLTPPITYGPNRRIGAMGAYVITVDLDAKQFVPASDWINLNN